ncbi:MAG: twin-arginine translocation signal domain-containing protein [Bacteroidales bacterium]|nr:twin-arginine translocation signal domain-containing protein [Bacteroidales bacterium]
MVKTKLTRRQFVSTITAGAGTVIIGNAALASSSSGTAISSPAMKIITLGKSGLKTTLLGMGTGFSGYNRSSNITRAGVAESVIRNAYEKESASLTVLTAMERILIRHQL